jgi:hypothetical protein
MFWRLIEIKSRRIDGLASCVGPSISSDRGVLSGFRDPIKMLILCSSRTTKHQKGGNCHTTDVYDIVKCAHLHGTE